MGREQLEMRLVQAGDPRFAALLRALDQEYVNRFGSLALKYRQYNGIEDLEQVCLLLREGQAVACGAFRRLDEATAELKRIYVRLAFRRRGYARQLVELLELQAMFQGYGRAALETGREMHEAVALYTAMGYREVPAWGPFAGDAHCICMAKTLGE